MFLKSAEEKTTFQLDDVFVFKQKAIYWANLFDTFCLLDNNQDNLYTYHSFEWKLAVDALAFIENESFEQLETFKKDKNVFGFLAYDLKNKIEKLHSENEDKLKIPDLFFFEPRFLLEINDNLLSINRNYPEAFHLLDLINQIVLPEKYVSQEVALDLNVTKQEYINNVEAIKKHIVEGDIYELNYCVEYSKTQIDLDTLAVFNAINPSIAAPFSAYLKYKRYAILCFSPERFLRKENKKVISQPIKGTIKAGETSEENEKLKNTLYNDEKERAENVMIVDLVRNDLTKSAQTGTIKVEELFKIYGFKTINQMISTVSATLREGMKTTDSIKNTFPMGSMTGTPKVRAMQVIENIEKQKRGIYSGAIGYFTRQDDFDFNVVIRSLVYDTKQKYLSLQVGGAITYDSVPEKEWQETLEKIKAIVERI